MCENANSRRMKMPVWADEWSVPEGLPLGLGALTNYQVAVDLLDYLRTHSISLCTGAFDVTQFVVQAVPGWTLTNYDPASTMKSSGTLVFNDFAANYSRELTSADGLRENSEEMKHGSIAKEQRVRYPAF
jgi:hypothetical protein